MKIIVSVTPLPVDADTRTYKIASSFSRFGYSSVVLEGETSSLQTPGALFKLHSINKKGASYDTDGGKSSVKDSGSDLRLIREWIKKILPDSLRQLLSFVSYYFPRYVLDLLGKIPRASLYYLHSPYQYPAVYLASRWYRAPYIYDAHDFYPVVSPGIVYRWIEARCIRNAAAVVTVSEGVANLMREEYGCHPIVLRNSQDERLEQELEQGLRQCLGLSEHDFLLVVVGQAKEGQAVAEALDALRNVPPRVHLVFLGKRSDKFQEMVTKAGLDTRVHLLPPVKPYEVVPFIRSADASLILYYPFSANYEHCLPNGFFQSVAAELPLLYPKLPEINHLAEQYKLGIPIDPRSPKSIRAGIIHLLGHPDRLKTYRQNIHEAKSKLSWEQEEHILSDLVARVLNENPTK